MAVPFLLFHIICVFLFDLTINLRPDQSSRVSINSHFLVQKTAVICGEVCSNMLCDVFLFSDLTHLPQQICGHSSQRLHRAAAGR